ncbi:TonB-dependent receptor [Brevundimonas sp.]|uniref:TonB-dependent receptor domain-containing protein n=1 Tax=Brevundimonas sp. TaxID=1871086 RepID=UPI0025BC6B33|nr:TonB-dependent receptor [Brevundimonas sp.]
MKIHSIRQKLLTSSILFGAIMIGATPVIAQEATPPVGTDVSEIVVTGSRIRQANLTTTSPVTQVTSEDIAASGVSRIEDMVTQLPQAFASQNSTVSNGASGTATVSLRNLGASRTLVLIDGRRMGYGSPNDIAADLNQIPGSLVERIEVLTGGASAVYGSDAVAGVVNFIMKKDFEGIQLDAKYGFYQHNNDYDGVGNIREAIAARAETNASQFQLPNDNVIDGESRDVTLTMGVSSPDGRGNLTAYAGYRSNNAVLQANRDYSACTITAPSSGDTYDCGGSSTSYPGRFIASTGSYTLGENQTFVPYSASENAYNYGPMNYYQRPDERYTFGAFGHYQINDHAEAYAQLMFTDYSSVAQIAPSGDFFNTSTINCDNPLMSAQQATTIGCTAANIAAGDSVSLLIGRRNVEGGGRQDVLNYESYRAVGGVRGEISNGWDYDVTGQFSKVRLSRVYTNDFSVTRLTRALDVVSVDGVATCRSVVDGTDPNCVPYDIFSEGGVTQEALDYLQIPLVQTGETTQQVLTAAMTGDLGQYGVRSPYADGGVQVAFGAEYRRDALTSTTDAAFASGDGAGQGGPTIGVSGSSDVIDIFGEVQVPLIDNLPGIYSASLNAAYRRSEYSSLSTDTYTVGFDYAPVQDLRLRTSYSEAVRAPNVLELYSAQGLGLFDLDADPCGEAMTATLAQCVATGMSADDYGSSVVDNSAGQYNQLTGGNEDLNPETAKTFTLGAVYTPGFLPGFNISVDYFNISVDDLISTVGAANTLALCYDDNDAAACARINRDADTGALWLGDGYVENLSINIGGLKTSGVDVNANYGFDLADVRLPAVGSIRLAFTGTWLETLETDTGTQTASSVYDCVGYYGSDQCGSPNPEWRHRAQITWRTPWTVDLSGTWRHIGSVDFGSSLTGKVEGELDSTFDAMNYFDLGATWQVNDTLEARVGVNNVLDSDPPVSPSGANGNTYPALYDALGRYVFVSLKKNF